MKNSTTYTFFIILLAVTITSCKQGNDDIKPFEERIFFKQLNHVIISDTTQSVSDTFLLDMNNDDKIDYGFTFQLNYYYKGYYYNPFFMYAYSLDENDMLFNNDPESGAYILDLKEGEEIKGVWGFPYGDLANYPLNLPWEAKGPKYMGLRIRSNNKTYIGWIKLEIAKKGREIKFYECAYTLYTGKPFYAGQK